MKPLPTWAGFLLVAGLSGGLGYTLLARAGNLPSVAPSTEPTATHSTPRLAGHGPQPGEQAITPAALPTAGQGGPAAGTAGGDDAARAALGRMLENPVVPARTADLLRGVRNLAVEVEVAGPAAQLPAFSEAALRATVEGRIRQAGIAVRETNADRVVDPDAHPLRQNRPRLRLGVSAVWQTDGRGLALVSELCVRRFGYVVADGVGFITATPVIWSDRRLCTVVAPHLGEARDMIGRQLDAFVNDYLTANPK